MINELTLLENEDVIIEQKGVAGVITLNRSHVFNALSYSMIRRIRAALQTWRQSPNVHFVLIKSTCKQAFCAGGDLKSVYLARRNFEYSFLEKFFREEYTLNYEIQTFPKPYVSMIDGIVMGGGVGLSIHGSHRLISENTRFAMPETAIGYFPDVGATYFLPRIPNKLGFYVGLSGVHFHASDSFFLGFGTHYIKSKDFLALERDFFNLHEADASIIDSVIKKYHSPPRHAAIENFVDEIASLFQKESLKEIVNDLYKTSSPFSKSLLQTLLQRSPTSLLITFEQLQQGSILDSFSDAMRIEFDLSQNLIHSHDFPEGIRAAVIDKDRQPKFCPSSIHDLVTDSVKMWFKPHSQPLLLP